VRAAVRRRNRSGRTRVAVIALVTVVAVVATLMLLARPWSGSSTGSGSAPGSDAGPAGATAPASPDQASPDAVARAERNRLTAAGWVARNVGRDNLVACDAATCTSLAARGFPASSLIRLGSDEGDLRRGDLVVVTGAVRAEFDQDLTDLLSPARLAVFGTGADTVEVTRVVTAGPEAHRRALAADRDDRQAAGRRLVTNPRLTAGAGVRRLLNAGRVDGRVLTVLAPLLSRHRLQVAAFRSTAEEAAAGVPLRVVEINRIDGMRIDQDAPGTRDVVTFVAAQRPPFGPGRVDFPRGAPVLRVTYPAPDPLGLLDR
jgi:hypothetical protein